MKLVEHTVTEFINQVDSKTATPGGGSVSALAGSLGIALTKMVGHLTIGKKKFKALDQDIQDEFTDILDTFQTYKEQLTELIDKDTEAYNLVMKAYQLPKETEQEQATRNQSILEATIIAIETPYNIAVLSLEALKDLDFIVQYGNKFAISDLGVSALLLYASLEGALLNVKINLPGLTDQEMILTYQNQVKQMLQEGKELQETLLQKIHNQL